MNASLTLASLPLFPLHTVLFPGGTLSLRVFEQRYRAMVHDCSAQATPFGIVALRSGSEILRAQPSEVRFHTVGTLAHIQSVTPLGTALELLHCTGHERFRITASRQLEGGLWTGDAELISADLPTPIPQDLQHSADALQKVLLRLPPRFQQCKEPLFSDCGWVANRWCELFPMNEQLQQRLMEQASPLLRLELITDALERSGIIPRHALPD